VIRYPVFKAQLLVEILPGEGVLLLSEDTTRALHGRLYEHLAPLLDGAHSVPQLVAALAPQFDGTHVHYALALLEKTAMSRGLGRCMHQAMQPATAALPTTLRATGSYIVSSPNAVARLIRR